MSRIISKNGFILSDEHGNLYSNQHHGSTCRCPLCGRNAADSNRVRRSYAQVGIWTHETGHNTDGLSTTETRRLRRVRENRIIQELILEDLTNTDDIELITYEPDESYHYTTQEV